MTAYEVENAARAELEQVRARIQEAQSRNDSKEANRHYRREMEILARLHGNEPRVGGRGPDKQRTA
jgi:hypothetical protein